MGGPRTLENEKGAQGMHALKGAQEKAEKHPSYIALGDSPTGGAAGVTAAHMRSSLRWMCSYLMWSRSRSISPILMASSYDFFNSSTALASSSRSLATRR